MSKESFVLGIAGGEVESTSLPLVHPFYRLLGFVLFSGEALWRSCKIPQWEFLSLSFEGGNHSSIQLASSG